MAYVQVTRIRPSTPLGLVADAGALMGAGLAVPFVMLLAGLPIALLIAAALWLGGRLFGG